MWYNVFLSSLRMLAEAHFGTEALQGLLEMVLRNDRPSQRPCQSAGPCLCCLCRWPRHCAVHMSSLQGHSCALKLLKAGASEATKGWCFSRYFG